MGERVEMRSEMRRATVLGWAGRVVVLTVTAAVFVGMAPGMASARPVNPSDGQIGSAEQQANAAAAQMGQLTQQLATAQAAVDSAHAHAALALDQFEGKQAEYEAAQAAAQKAQAAAQKAQADFQAARADVIDFARDSYMAGSTSPRMQSLITSGSPAQLLERAALLDAVGNHRSDVVVRVGVVHKQATAAATQATATAQKAAELKTEAAGALASAEQLEIGARQQASAVQAQQAVLQTQLQQAQQVVANLEGQRAASVLYDQQQAAAQQAAQDAFNRSAQSSSSSSNSSSSNSSSSNSSSSNSSSSNSSDSSSSSSSSGPTAGPGSASAAETAIRAAMQWVGTSYAWGGGSLTGPSEGWGIDQGVVGFDCSGLTRYAYAQAGISIPRNSTAQYLALPKVSRSDLKRGDLVFYAFDTSNPQTIHHVAIYLGGGKMLEAPESGLTVRVTAMRWGSYIGAVRPSAA